ncbi:sterigmatocystin biosynthesis peroxidase stcC [Diaporthe eres]|uniref:Heme haloperoxidase family profile domain-containing protein n=1 Tax=Diaporthe vaccinii TaxID=105482 RepID=A0ABR4F942_9PEZI|nr:sterigmatocystin biosynthesis peroxidase stcC [Diaporthe eres]
MSQQPRFTVSLLTCILGGSVVSSYPSLTMRQEAASDDINPFIAPSEIEDSIRGPCPGLNILANHGYIPRNGRNISSAAAIKAQMTAFNFDQASAASPIAGALSVSTTGYSDTFNLDDLTRPGADRDGDLSRADSVIQHWPDATVTFAQAAEARAARLRDAAAENPEFTQPEAAVNGSFTQLAGVLCAFGGSAVDGQARRD